MPMPSSLFSPQRHEQQTPPTSPDQSFQRGFYQNGSPLGRWAPPSPNLSPDSGDASFEDWRLWDSDEPPAWMSTGMSNPQEPACASTHSGQRPSAPEWWWPSQSEWQSTAAGSRNPSTEWHRGGAWWEQQGHANLAGSRPLLPQSPSTGVRLAKAKNGAGANASQKAPQPKEGSARRRGKPDRASPVPEAAANQLQQLKTRKKTFLALLKAQKAKLRSLPRFAGKPVSSPRSRTGKQGSSRGPPRAEPRQLESHWVLGNSEEFVNKVDKTDGDSSEASDLSKLKSLVVRLESTLVGCKVMAHLNETELCFSSNRPSKCTFRINAHQTAFSDTPALPQGGQVLSPVATAPVDSFCEQIAGAEVSDDTIPCGKATSCQFSPFELAAKLELKTEMMEVRTSRELVEPLVEVVDIYETAAVLRIHNLSGDKFELTVYASGSFDSSSKATLVKGAVSSTDSVHHIAQLEPSQVYVAWVRVFCADQVRESAQKGFKTREAKVKTIWEEPDHAILGVSEKASEREIVRAFRQKSLQFHPDKEADPEKKAQAEEMMKRLNLAKQQMLRCTSGDGASIRDCHNVPASGSGRGGPDNSPRYGFNACDWSDSDGEESGHVDHLFVNLGGSRDKKHFDDAGDDSDDSDQGPDCVDAQPGESLTCFLRVVGSRAPELEVLERHLTSIHLEASSLPIGGTLEVQKFVDSNWTLAMPAMPIDAPRVSFFLDNLEEYSTYQLRMRTTWTVDSLCISFASLAEEVVTA